MLGWVGCGGLKRGKVGSESGVDVVGEVCVCLNDKRASRHHFGGKVGGVEGAAMEVLEHRPGAPATHQSCFRGVDACSQERHGAPGAKGPGADVFGSQARDGAYDFAALA